MGSVNKSETDILIYYLLNKYQGENELNLTNFEWSSLLKISERKIKNLRLEVGIRYASDSEQDELHSWFSVLELIANGFLEFEGPGKVILTIENPYLLRFIEHKLKTFKLSATDYSFNSERIKLKVSSLEKLLSAAAEEIKIGKGNTMAEEKLKNAKWKNYGKEAMKQVFSILTRAIPVLMKEVKNPIS